MKHLNIRDIPYREPFVSIGPPMPLTRPTEPEPEPRSSDEIAVERENAVAEQRSLQARRVETLKNGAPDDVAEIDRRLALVAVRIEQADAQHPVALAREAEERAAAEAEQRRRKTFHRQASKASAEIAKLAEEYVSAARQMAVLLAKVREREDLIADANAALPEGAEPVPPGEPHNGRPGVPAYPHYRLSRRVRLPALGRDAGFIWGEAELIGRSISHEQH